MVQAQALYPELIYYRDEDSNKLIVSQYIPSKYEFDHNGNSISIEQTTGMKYYNDQAFFDEHDDGQMSRWLLKFIVKTASPEKFTVAFRIPAWAKGEPEVEINGKKPESLDIADGYLNITAEWNSDMVQIFFPNGIVMESLPDMPEMAAAYRSCGYHRQGLRTCGSGRSRQCIHMADRAHLRHIPLEAEFLPHKGSACEHHLQAPLRCYRRDIHSLLHQEVIFVLHGGHALVLSEHFHKIFFIVEAA